jgi:hypothetical protein
MVVCHYSEYISEQKRLANLKGMNSAAITKTTELYLFKGGNISGDIF